MLRGRGGTGRGDVTVGAWAAVVGQDGCVLLSVLTVNLVTSYTRGGGDGVVVTPGPITRMAGGPARRVDKCRRSESMR